MKSRQSYHCLYYSTNTYCDYPCSSSASSSADFQENLQVDGEDAACPEAWPDQGSASKICLRSTFAISHGRSSISGVSNKFNTWQRIKGHQAAAIHTEGVLLLCTPTDKKKPFMQNPEIGVKMTYDCLTWKWWIEQSWQGFSNIQTCEPQKSIRNSPTAICKHVCN